MKKDIHPEYEAVMVQCACGANFTTRSTLKRDIQVDICSSCHPFFTGKQKFVDTAGRIDRLKKKFGTKLALGSQKRQKEAKPNIATPQQEDNASATSEKPAE